MLHTPLRKILCVISGNSSSIETGGSCKRNRGPLSKAKSYHPYICIQVEGWLGPGIGQSQTVPGWTVSLCGAQEMPIARPHGTQALKRAQEQWPVEEVDVRPP